MTPEPDWDPVSAEVVADRNAAYDDMRRRCPVAYSEKLGWSLFRHQEVTRALHDGETFSSVVSAHLAVPSGMDPPTHTPYRRVVESYFEPQRMDSFEPICRELVGEQVLALPRRAQVDLVADFAEPFALNVQCAFAGWPMEIRQTLRFWLAKSQKESCGVSVTSRGHPANAHCRPGLLSTLRLRSPAAFLEPRGF